MNLRDNLTELPDHVKKKDGAMAGQVRYNHVIRNRNVAVTVNF